MTVIYVDADACPVKDEIITIAIRHGCRAVMVCNGGIRRPAVGRPPDARVLCLTPSTCRTLRATLKVDL